MATRTRRADGTTGDWAIVKLNRGEAEAWIDQFLALIVALLVATSSGSISGRHLSDVDDD